MSDHTIASGAAAVRGSPASRRTSAKELYFKLYEAPQEHGQQARDFLAAQIASVRGLPSDLPAAPEGLADWIDERTDAVGAEYRNYLQARKQGAPRRYFRNRAHALYFIKAVAPTKLVDGSWLYALVRHWNHADYQPLIQTYLEELGEGVPDKNHVTLYRRLLATHGCDGWERLDEQHFVQGAIQLALGHHADAFLPEVIGYNLGYEQLPLHLLITSYELNELGIDPYYFTLHVTVDNAGNGHARKAVQALQQLMPRHGDREDFYRRVHDGYRLNEPGASTTSVIAGFDIERELVGILAAKSRVGRHMHSDYCRVAGRGINDWLAEPARIPDFLRALEGAGWIKRGEAPANSRFWRLVEGEHAEMFGVFSAYERQVLRDWIATGADGAQAQEERVLSYRARRRALDNLAGDGEADAPPTPRGLFRRHAGGAERDDGNELAMLERQVAAAAGKAEAMRLLAGLLAPQVHHSAAGLMATRLYTRLLQA